MDANETKIFTAILIAAGILGFIVVYFIFTIIRNQRRHIKMHQANLHLEITALENERKRIVSDLHDELGPLLSVVKLQISDLETTNPADLRIIGKAGNHLDDIVARIRVICNHLMPQVLIRKGLITAITEFLDDLDDHSGIKIRFVSNDMVFSPHVEIHIYRMIQEIVNNAVKHSNATEINIILQDAGSKLLINVHDNGKGFDTEKIQRESSGAGLKNILNRVDILKGDLYLSSSSKKGTTFTIELPKGLTHGYSH